MNREFASAKASWTKLAKTVRPFILDASLRPAMRKVVNSPQMIPEESLRDALYSKGTMFATRTQIMPYLLSSDPVRPPWRQPSYSMPLVHNQGFQRPRQMQSKPTFRPSLLGCPHGYLSQETAGQKTGVKNFGSLWFLWF